MCKKLSQYNIEILYILAFQVLSMLSDKFLVLCKFSHILRQIPGYFSTWINKMKISRFPGSAVPDNSIIMKLCQRHIKFKSVR